jgi:hypothetical protein
MRQAPPLGIASSCQCRFDDPGMCGFCQWSREEDERDAHDEAFASEEAVMDPEARAAEEHRQEQDQQHQADQ